MSSAMKWVWIAVLVVSGFACDSGSDSNTNENKDLCKNVECGSSEKCDPDTGDCVEQDLCNSVKCAENEECDISTGMCIKLDPCAKVDCGTGYVCDLATGDCIIADLCVDVLCDGDYACDPLTGKCEIIESCSEDTCSDGFSCNDVTGNCDYHTNDTVMTPDELCLMHYLSQNYNEVSDYRCVAVSTVMPVDIGSDEFAFGCAPGSDGWLFSERMLNAINDGRLVIDWTKAHECIDWARDIRSRVPALELGINDEWLELQAGACAEFASGLIENNGSCLEDWDCAAAGSGCYTDTPFVPDSKTCMPKAAQGETCDWDFHPCKPGFVCEDKTNKCSIDIDYVEKSDIGGPCGYSADCNVTCSYCDNTGHCALIGGEGTPCTTWDYCAVDLGCTDGVCTAVGLGEPCGPINYGLCEEGLGCVHDCLKYTDPDSCAEAGCEPNYDYEMCFPPQGEDFSCAAMPSDGELCLMGLYCQWPAYCDQNENLEVPACVNYALKGEICDPDGIIAPFCNFYFGLGCDNGVCRKMCSYDEECEDGFYCDYSDTGSCLPLKPNTCLLQDECPNNQYCPVCEAYGYEEWGNDTNCINDEKCQWDIVPEDSFCLWKCQAIETQVDCEAKAGCLWDDYYDCLPSCHTLDITEDPAVCNDTPGCKVANEQECYWHVDCISLTTAENCSAETECTWWPELDICSEVCYLHDEDQTTCESTTGCVWDPMFSYCDPICENFELANCESDSQGQCKIYERSFCWYIDDCSELHEDSDACNTAPECFFDPFYGCSAITPETTTFVCTDKGMVGDACLFNETCETEWCGMVDETTAKCMHDSYEIGCYDFALLQSVFMLGVVWIFARRRRQS